MFSPKCLEFVKSQAPPESGAKTKLDDFFCLLKMHTKEVNQVSKPPESGHRTKVNFACALHFIAPALLVRFTAAWWSGAETFLEQTKDIEFTIKIIVVAHVR